VAKKKKEAKSSSEPAEVREATDAVRLAKAELAKAQQLYEGVRQKAAEKVKKAKEMTLGEVIDDTLQVVKKHPGPAVIIATFVGFFLGRLFRR
jgi:ElaB/YqjD/DUF883 family membrane-anchored ribosome-binding protein